MGPEMLAAPWDVPWGESHPLPPLLAYMGGDMPDLLSGQRLLPEKFGARVRAGKGEEWRGKGVYWEVVTISDTQSPREEVPWSLALALPLESAQLSSELHLLPNSPSKETAGQSCEERGMKGREQEGDPSCPFPAVVGRQGREGAEEAEAGGDLWWRLASRRGRHRNESSPEDLFLISRTSRAWMPWDCSWPRICKGRYRLGPAQHRGLLW